MKKRKFFLGLIIAEIILFALCCASIIYCVINGNTVPDAKKAEHTMAFVFLFLHLIVISVFFFYSVRAYLTKSVLVQAITTLDNGQRNRKSTIICSILAVLLLALAVFFTLAIFGVPDIKNVFSLGLHFALANVGYTVSTMCIFLVFYKPDETTE